MVIDHALEFLLQLDGETYYEDDGFWTKFHVRLIEPNVGVPHGIRYSFTLHDKRGTRIVGFDNAHVIKPKKKKYGGRKVTWDHKHMREIVEPYEFESPEQLLDDFWKAVYAIKAE